MLKGWVVADLAVTCASLLHHSDGDPFHILPAVKAFHAVCPLTDAELKALWPLIVARACGSRGEHGRSSSRSIRKCLCRRQCRMSGNLRRCRFRALSNS
ncbi:hypothetical protein F2981_02305 [Sinorhizobium meliloti]|nr:hypothetical protein [Sinorhizobium meliloti]